MKAIQYLGSNHIELVDAPIPDTPKGWAKIKVSHAGICGTDLNIYAGTHPRAKAPLIIGHEFSGILENDTSVLKKGERVTVYPLISCGHCTPCKSGNSHVCNTLGLYGIDADGGFAEYAFVPEENLVRIPDELSLKVGALIEPIAVAVHTLRETSFTPGDNAIVLGAGTIGLCVALTLRLFGASEVIISETDDARRSLARELGFETINPAKDDMIAFTAEKTNGDGFDRVYDCAGVQAVASTLLDLVKVRGQIVIVASYKKPAELPLFKGMAKETSIHFVRVYRKKDVEIAAQIVSRESLYARIVTHVLMPEEAQKGFDLLFTKGTGAIKVMYHFSKEDM